MTTRVVHVQHEPYTLYIGRTMIVDDIVYPRSKWSNPFRIGVHGSREQVLEKYRAWVVKQPHLMAALDELDGQVVGCWCKKDGQDIPCHGDVLVALIGALEHAL